MGDLTGGYIGSMHHAWAERSNGMAEGFVTGKNVGFDNGYDEGLDDGRAQGFRNGRAQGYREGYNVGWQESATALQPRIDKLNAGIEKGNEINARLNAGIEKANEWLAEKNTALDNLQAQNAKLAAELATLKAQQQQGAAMQAALRKANEQLQQQLQQTGSIQAVLRKSNTAIDSLQTQNAKLAAEMEGLKSLLQQTADERDKKHALVMEQRLRYNRISVALGAARDTLREITEPKCEPARRIAKLFNQNYARTEGEFLAKNWIKMPVMKDPAFETEAPRTYDLIHDMQFIEHTDPPARMPFETDDFYKD